MHRNHSGVGCTQFTRTPTYYSKIWSSHFYMLTHCASLCRVPQQFLEKTNHSANGTLFRPQNKQIEYYIFQEKIVARRALIRNFQVFTIESKQFFRIVPEFYRDVFYGTFFSRRTFRQILVGDAFRLSRNDFPKPIF